MGDTGFRVKGLAVTEDAKSPEDEVGHGSCPFNVQWGFQERISCGPSG